MLVCCFLASSVSFITSWCCYTVLPVRFDVTRLDSETTLFLFPLPDNAVSPERVLLSAIIDYILALFLLMSISPLSGHRLEDKAISTSLSNVRAFTFINFEADHWLILSTFLCVSNSHARFLRYLQVELVTERTRS